MAESTEVEGSTQPEVNEIEQKAIEKGWRPKEEWHEVDGKEWVPADEFLRREPIFDRMRALKNKVSTMEQDMRLVAQHLEKVRQVEYERARADLLKEKREALTEGDVDRVIEIDERVAQLKEESKTPAVPVGEAQVQQIFADWSAENKWFFENEEMQTYAEGYGLRLKKQEPNLPYDQFLNKIADKTKQQFKKEASARPSAVDTGTTDGRSVTKATSRGGKLKESDLSDTDRRIMNTILRSGVKLTKEQYLDQLSEAQNR